MWILACSGPGAMVEIARSIAFARQQAIIVAVFAAVSSCLWLVSGRRISAAVCSLPLPTVCLLLLARHPAWTWSATSGDCGAWVVLGACLYSAIALLIVLFQFNVVVVSRRRQR